MPPRARGRGARSRGTSRTASTSSRNAADTTTAAEATPPTQEAHTEAAESSKAPVIPKQEADTDITTAADADTSATADAHSAPSSDATSLTTSQASTEPSARVPRQRLDSLKSAEPTARSLSPSTRRGTSSRGKKGSVALPSFTGRRAKEERDARNREALDREKERNKERDALAKKKQKEKEEADKRAAWKAASRGRGGFGGAISGPFAHYSSRQDRRSANRNFAQGSGSGSGSRATRVKSEHDDRAGPSHRSSGPAIKNEDGGYVSSDDDQNAEFPRKDIDFIEISSDEDEAAPIGSRGRGFLPVRIGRKEHKERVIGINTEASTEASAKLLQQAEASGSAPTADVLERTTQKAKGKMKDLEITGERKPYKGMWQDDDRPDVEVKPEPLSDEDMAGAEQVGIGASSNKAGKQAEQSPAEERKPKPRSKPEPNLQTDEERAEWARIQSNLQHIRAELGPATELQTVDGSGDVSMTDAAANASKPSVRDDHVYLFQFPPTMPDLLLPGVKKEPSDAQLSNLQPPPGGELVIKKEEESANLAQIPEGPRLSSGKVGKLRVHQSGRTTLDWGGTSYELTPGNQASFLQEVVSMHVVPEKDRVVEEDAGEAISFGRVKGKFVVTPDFSQLFN